MRFAKSHEWITPDGKVGISHYAQKELGEIVYVQLPKIGQDVQAGQEVCVLESTKAASDIYSPASGKVIAVNEAVANNPHLINQAPETTWLFQIALSHPKELDSLLTQEQYKKSH